MYNKQQNKIKRGGTSVPFIVQSLTLMALNNSQDEA